MLPTLSAIFPDIIPLMSLISILSGRFLYLSTQCFECFISVVVLVFPSAFSDSLVVLFYNILFSFHG